MNLNKDIDLKLDDRLNKIINTQVNNDKKHYVNKHEFPDDFFSQLDNKQKEIRNNYIKFSIEHPESHIIEKSKEQ